MSSEIDFRRNHLMIDLETWGLSPGAAIRTIAAVPFHPKGNIASQGPPPDSIHYAVHEECIDRLGFTKNLDTIDWWKKNHKANDVILSMPAYSLEGILDALMQLCFSNKVEYVWSHGSIFDIPILEEAASRCGKNTPWAFYNIRDTRTIYHAAFGTQFKLFTNNHVALDDCVQQIRYVQEACAYLKLVNF